MDPPKANFFLFDISKVTIILLQNPKYYFLKMSTSKDICARYIYGSARTLAWICKNLLCYLRVARQQRTVKGQINAESLNINIFGSRHFLKEKLQSCSMIMFLSIC